MSETETTQTAERQKRADNPAFLDILNLAILGIRFAMLSKKIRSRGKFVAKQLHDLQSEAEMIVGRLRKRISPIGNLLSNLGARGKEIEEVLVNLLKKDI